jgi:membrane protein YdbS with pleckstrin-like domain
MKQLHPGAKWLFRIRFYFSFLFFLFFLGCFILPFLMRDAFESSFNTFLTIFFQRFSLVFILGILIILIFGEFYSRLSYKNWKYEMASNELKLERGIIWKKYSFIPYERVQNVDINRGILARIIGFSTISIQTAGYHFAGNARNFGARAEGYIPAVSVEEAEKIRVFLMKKIGKKQGL